MTIFDVVNDIRLRKTGEFVDDDSLKEVCRNPYMLQRWVTMGAPDTIGVLNQTTNRLLDQFETNCIDLYRFLIDIVPQRRYSNFRYLKTIKNSDNDMEDEIKTMANTKEISLREARSAMEMIEKIMIMRNPPQEDNVKGKK